MEANFGANTTGDLVELCTATPDNAIGTAAINFCEGFAQASQGIVTACAQGDQSVNARAGNAMKDPFGLFSGSIGPQLLRPAMARAVGFVVLWLVLAGGNPIDLAPGAVAALAATWVSFRLLPPGGISVQPAALPRFALRFVCQSVLAGVDVARRALDPSLPLHPGFVVYPVGLRPGPKRNMFTTLISLLPGTVPTGPAPGSGLLIHCLDVEQPITAQLAAEEALFSSVIGWKKDNG